MTKKGSICMDKNIWNTADEYLDEYGFPEIFSPAVLSQMRENLTISQEVFQNIHSYFDAAGNLYARISLRKLFEIYNDQNPPISQENFLEAAYQESHESDPPDIRNGFRELDDLLRHLPLEDNNAVFNLCCSLCTAYEHKAFLDGLQYGAHLITELNTDKRGEPL